MVGASGNPTLFTSSPFFVICLSYACRTNTSFISLVVLSDPCHIRFGKKNGFPSCDGNSGFSCDLILKEVSELNGIVRIIVRSVCEQF